MTISIGMKSKLPKNPHDELVETWPLSYAATLGSSMRVKGIFLEARAHLPRTAKKALTLRDRALVLQMPIQSEHEFRSAALLVSKTIKGIESLPVIPREIEDVLSISTTERHRWLKDGRLPSAGLRSVKLHGRAKQVTFHVFDPRVVEDILDRDLVATWREEDIEAATERRRHGVWKAKLTRLKKVAASKTSGSTDDDEVGTALQGWDEFERHGPLR